jgi:Phosphate-induced protein 1 conserved region
MRNSLLAVVLGLCFVGALAAQTHSTSGAFVPIGKGKGTAVFQPGAPPVVPGIVDNGIQYHGGPVMHGTLHIYFIYYGNWSTSTAAVGILEDWANHIGGSDYFNINTTYTDGSGAVNNSITFGGSADDNYSQGTSLTDGEVLTVVSNAITSHHLPLDSQGIYFVLSSADVAETSGFCSVYCGWHTYGTVSSTTIKYAFVGNHDRCPSSCMEFPSNAPNGNVGADGMISTMTHELEETATDPLLNAWYDIDGNEDADKCAYIYGSTYGTSNGSIANVHLGSRNYLIQQEWINANGGGCQTAYNPGQSFYTVSLCRLIDTRNPTGPYGGPALAAGTNRAFAFAGHCGVPATAKAVSINVTVTGTTALGYLTLFPVDQSLPLTSVINFLAGATRTDNAIIVLSGEGTGTLNVRNGSGGALHLIVDVNGYFQ